MNDRAATTETHPELRFRFGEASVLEFPVEQLELSVVIPCLDEAETIGACVKAALETIREHQIDGEVIVADNGSTDGSIAIAEDRKSVV